MRKLVVVFELAKGIYLYVNVYVESPADAWAVAHKHVVSRFPSLNDNMIGECRIFDACGVGVSSQPFLADVDLPTQVRK